MDQCEDRDDRVPPSKSTLCGEHEDQSKAQRKLEEPQTGPGPEPESESEADSDSSCESFKSHDSKDVIIHFKLGQSSAANRVDQQNSEDPCGLTAQQQQTQLDSLFMLLEDNIVTFVKNELKKIQKVLSPDDPECLESQWGDEELLEGEDEEQRRSNREAFLKITIDFLKKMKQEELAERLQSKYVASICQHKLKSRLKKRFQCVFEESAKAGSPTILNQIYTELYITEGGTGEVNDKHE
ncbi:hypothetical protein AMECASPLE_027064, partial [Ameca splendens]